MSSRGRFCFGLVLCALVSAQLSCGDSSGPGAVASSISANSPTTQTAQPGTAVADPPSVIVRDQNGAVLAGVPVTFAITAGGGSVTGGSAVTNSAGVATVGSWTVGTVEGTNTLSATSGNLSVAFTANSIDACVVSATHPIGGTTNGELAVSDCKFGDESLVDFWATALAAAGTYLFNQSSSRFDTYLILYDANANPIGFNDDFGAGSDSRIKAILPPGDYVLGANSYDASGMGAYILTSTVDGGPVTNCELVFVTRGTSTAQTLDASDCARVGGYYGDQFFIWVTAGQSVTVSMSSTAVDAYIGIADTNGAALANNDNKDSTTQDSQVTFTASVSGFYAIVASSANVGATGAYTTTVQ
jgi:hypothetical protein